MQDQTDAYDAIINRLGSMESRMRASAQTMADVLSNLAELQTKFDDLADDDPKYEDHVTMMFVNTLKVCTESSQVTMISSTNAMTVSITLGKRVVGIEAGLQTTVTMVGDLNNRLNTGGRQVYKNVFTTTTPTTTVIDRSST